MSNLIGHPIGPGGLTESLSEDEFLAAVAAAIKKVPHASGLNNHTGSYLTQQIQQMNWLMEDIKRRDFFFVDSRTTAKSVAHKVARRKQILTSGRDVFLDNDQSFFEIDRAFHRLIQVARRNGTAWCAPVSRPRTRPWRASRRSPTRSTGSSGWSRSPVWSLRWFSSAGAMSTTTSPATRDSRARGPVFSSWPGSRFSSFYQPIFW